MANRLEEFTGKCEYCYRNTNGLRVVQLKEEVVNGVPIWGKQLVICPTCHSALVGLFRYAKEDEVGDRI